MHLYLRIPVFDRGMGLFIRAAFHRQKERVAGKKKKKKNQKEGSFKPWHLVVLLISEIPVYLREAFVWQENPAVSSEIVDLDVKSELRVTFAFRRRNSWK